MDGCRFCWCIDQQEGLDRIDSLESEEFLVSWDIYPATPGHALVIVKRHAQVMSELSLSEQQEIIRTVVAAKEYIRGVDLKEVYTTIIQRDPGAKAKGYLKWALEQLATVSRPPDAFNDGLNDGPMAGQTVPHFHWHIMPRWEGDMPDPRGGIRHMFPGMGNYHNGLINTIT